MLLENEMLIELFNKSLSNRTFEKCDNNYSTNYCPTPVLSCLGKPMER